MTTTRLGLFVLGFLAATGVEAVRADEAYLCDGGRIVKVPFGKLDEMKRTDACIAGYYGLTVESGSAQVEQGRIETGTIPPPTLAPADATAARASLTQPAGPRPGPGRPDALASNTPPARSAAKVQPVRAADGTDFRNVVLLNAEPGQPTVYRHER